jgi:hypothetical protein
MIQHGWAITEVDGKLFWVKNGVYYKVRKDIDDGYNPQAEALHDSDD